MQKKETIIIAIAAVLIVLLGVGVFYFYRQHEEQKQRNADLEELARLDKKEMENEYTQFALQYDELKKSIKDDSLMQQLDREQRRTEELLEELRRVKSNDAAEIARLKKELATVRAVLRTYIYQVDSLQRLNQDLTAERDEARARYSAATTQISSLNTERQNLSEKVAIASQLNATGVSISPQKKNGKNARRSKDIRRFTVSFTITRNVTAETGNRYVYVRLTKPSNEVINASGTFDYENRALEYSASKVIEYTGQELNVTMYVPADEFLSKGQYTAYIFCDGQMIGSGSTEIKR